MTIFENIKDITGIIHVGAHYGEEHEYYNSIGIKKQVWIEALKSNYDVLKRLESDDVICLHSAIGSRDGFIDMNLSSNNNESASLLKPHLHTSRMPHIMFNGTIRVNMTTLDNLIKGNYYNALVMDVQGYELEVLKGATELLEGIKYIWTEVNYEHLYENCVLIEELDAYLSDFKRVFNSNVGGWGDALYIRK